MRLQLKSLDPTLSVAVFYFLPFDTRDLLECLFQRLISQLGRQIRPGATLCTDFTPLLRQCSIILQLTRFSCLLFFVSLSDLTL